MDDEKLMVLLGMTESSKSLSDKELADLLNDEETRTYYEVMVMLKQSFQLRADGSSMQRINTSQSNRSRLRYAATVIFALLVMASVVVAAVYFGKIGSRETPSAVEIQNTEMQKENALDVEVSPEVIKKTYEDERMEIVLSEIARYYHMEVRYSNPDARSLRLHFIWNPADDIDTVVGIFNHFSHIAIHREGNILYVD